MARTTLATQLIERAIAALNYQTLTAADTYAHVGDILNYLNTEVHATSPIAVGTTGTILEQLCKFGLDAAVTDTPATVHRIPRQWKWVGDFSIPGDPFNLVISVKSFKARERVLASGSGSVLSPTVGWGAFNDPEEFTASRIISYAYRGFVSIYMPERTRDSLAPDALAFRNINGRPFIRPHRDFVPDIHSAINDNGRVNPGLL